MRHHEARYAIGDVAQLLNLPQHVLRFWEQHFIHLKPKKTANGRRLYEQEHIELLKIIKKLLHQEGYTIRGAGMLLNSKTMPNLADLKAGLRTTDGQNTKIRQGLQQALAELEMAEQWLTKTRKSL